MGIDLGGRNIGLAISDPHGWLATPLLVIPHRSKEVDIQTIAHHVSCNEVEAIVVGLPRNMDNTEGAAALKARRFARQLRYHLRLDVLLWDERLSTVDAHQAVAHHPKSRRRQPVDAIAAALILQNYLDSTGGGQSREPGQ